jgi:hypothetical protein
VLTYHAEPYTREAEIGEVSSQNPVVLKIHGDVDQNDMVVTQEDYVQFFARMTMREPYSPVPLEIRYFVEVWPLLFVGYSLLDVNLRVLFKILDRDSGFDPAERAPRYVVDVRLDLLLTETIGSSMPAIFVRGDIWDVIPELYDQLVGREPFAR